MNGYETLGQLKSDKINELLATCDPNGEFIEQLKDL